MAERATLILDVMGAEQGIAEVVKGAAQGCDDLQGESIKLYLVTTKPDETQQVVDTYFSASARQSSQVEIAQATQHLPTEFSNPVDVYKKHPQCSIRVAMNLAKDTPHSVVISPATTGLVMTSAIFTLGRVRGIDRTPIGTPMPTKGKQMFYVDGGSVVDCKPRHLYQFAVLAHLHVKNMLRIERPTIALLSNGSEEYKGNHLVREAYELLTADKDLNFVGYTEGHTMLEGKLDIMVCDGFLGNILLKFAEGVAESFFTMMREEFKREPLAGLAAKLLQRKAYQRLYDRLDYAQFGGAPLLGLNGNVVIMHGRSPALAFKNALIKGAKLARSGISEQVSQYINAHPQISMIGNGNGGSTDT